MEAQARYTEYYGPENQHTSLMDIDQTYVHYENKEHRNPSTNTDHFVKMILSKCLARQANLLRHTCDHHEYRFLI